jgi:hypothetical protein
MDTPAKLLARLGDEIIEICVTGDPRLALPGYGKMLWPTRTRSPSARH